MSVPPEQDRRDFMQAAAGLAAAALASKALGQPAPSPAVRTPTRGIVSLRLKAADPGALVPFYADTLGCPLVKRSDDSVTVRAGLTEITFDRSDTGEPYYHFAFNIPENMLAASKTWLAPRCPLIKRPDGSDEYHFRSWNAHSVYFNDPAGNILEFIARHNLPNAREGEFSVADILYASEIAVVVDDVGAAADTALETLGLGTFAQSRSEGFAAVGDDHRLLIVVKRGREWNSGHGRTAEVHPVHAVIDNPRAGRFESKEHRFEVVTG